LWRTTRICKESQLSFESRPAAEFEERELIDVPCGFSKHNRSDGFPSVRDVVQKVLFAETGIFTFLRDQRAADRVLRSSLPAQPDSPNKSNSLGHVYFWLDIPDLLTDALQSRESDIAALISSI
jgi:hypothetical protein